MNQTERLDVYRAQTKNVQKIEKALIQINRAINDAYKRGDMDSAEVHTKVMSIVFSAWVEAIFTKTIHTPYGFTLIEIQQIKQIQKNFSLEKGFEKCTSHLTV